MLFARGLAANMFSTFQLPADSLFHRQGLAWWDDCMSSATATSAEESLLRQAMHSLGALTCILKVKGKATEQALQDLKAVQQMVTTR